MHRILSFDPGVTTGYCIGEFDGKKLIVQPGQDKLSPSQLHSALLRNLPELDSLIYETFQYRNKARAGLDLTPVKLIGVIEMVEDDFPHTKFYPQSAALAKGYWTDDNLKAHQLYVTLRHGRDAMRHLLHWFQFKAGYTLHENPHFTNYELRAGS